MLWVQLCLCCGWMDGRRGALVSSSRMNHLQRQKSSEPVGATWVMPTIPRHHPKRVSRRRAVPDMGVCVLGRWNGIALPGQHFGGNIVARHHRARGNCPDAALCQYLGNVGESAENENPLLSFQHKLLVCQFSKKKLTQKRRNGCCTRATPIACCYVACAAAP